jgi:hypothetical protein
MSDYHICHRREHVSLDRECTRVPYGDVNLYDPSCHPYKLTLVGLIKHPVPVKSAKKDSVSIPQTDKKICVAKAHSHTVCTKEPVSADANEVGDGHKYVPFYKAGDWILITGQVSLDSTWANTYDAVSVTIPGGHRLAVRRRTIVGLTDEPLSEEPAKDKVLRSKKNGRFVGWSKNRWQYLDSITYFNNWEECFKQAGPFDIFSPDKVR